METAKMTIIVNIQAMQKILTGKANTYEELAEYTYEELHERQNSLIPYYNDAIKNNKTKY